MNHEERHGNSMDNLMLFKCSEKDWYCHVCDTPILVDEEVVLEIPAHRADGPILYYHVQCSGLCAHCLERLREEEFEDRVYMETEIWAVKQEHADEDVYGKE